MKKLLLIDDDASFNLMLKTFLGRFYNVDSALNGKEGFARLKKTAYDLLICDLRLPDHYGLDLLREVKEILSDLPIILMTGYGDIKSAVEAMKLGAIDYISKPIDPEELLTIVNNAIKKKKKPESIRNRAFVKSNSEISLKLEEYTALVAPTDMSVIVTGESGTGKEYVSRLIHEKSARKKKPFVAVDCGALANDIAGSELFGHIKGAFTGAYVDKAGCFETANSGTLFLDEIGNLSYDIQIQLLRAIQERSIRRLGGMKNIDIDVRILVATNEDLKIAVTKGRFREDLYHRLNEFTIEIPPLRARVEDIEMFSRHFLEQANNSLSKQILGFTPIVLTTLQQYAWPGNIRELGNVIKRAVLLCKENLITLNDLPGEITRKQGDSRAEETANHHTFDLKNITAQKEKELIESVLQQTHYNKSKAAKLLNIDRKTLYKRLKVFNIDA